ncbi:ParB/RepB/Spo0J family partition protein [Desulfatirhabdium butyrativorans]|uniref:ParB/RepB/Spo0J family partition protein n=1 Tax=Desulfatirhabdium butyrativorans TaxID=340467 RepID=UPI000403447D|nr:ParB/RepB/Spo0J family partition protein [Desulfatirhabdium butyrativorans]
MNYEKGKLYDLPLDALQADPNQPRKVMDPQALAELTTSITQMGVVQPIVFRLDEAGNTVIVAGERRVAAARAAGLSTVPGIFIEGNYAEVALVENVLRQDLTPVEEAEAMQALMSQQHYTQEQLGAIVGKAQNTLSEILSINRLPAEVRDDCRGNRAISRAALVTIAKKKQARGMVTAYQTLKEKLAKGKATRKAKGQKTAQDVIDAASQFGRKLTEVDASAWSDAEKSNYKAAIEALKTQLDEVLAALAAAATAPPASDATEGTKSTTSTRSSSRKKTG